MPVHASQLKFVQLKGLTSWFPLFPHLQKAPTLGDSHNKCGNFRMWVGKVVSDDRFWSFWLRDPRIS